MSSPKQDDRSEIDREKMSNPPQQVAGCYGTRPSTQSTTSSTQTDKAISHERERDRNYSANVATHAGYNGSIQRTTEPNNHSRPESAQDTTPTSGKPGMTDQQDSADKDAVPVQKKKKKKKKPVDKSNTPDHLKDVKRKQLTISVSDRLGRKTTVKCYNTDTIKRLKEIIAKKLGARPEKIKLQKSNLVFHDHITLYDYDLSDGMNLEMYNY